MGVFCPKHCGGGGGSGVINLKLIKKLSFGAESYVTITWNGFFTQSQVLLSTIVNKIVSQCSGTYLYSKMQMATYVERLWGIRKPFCAHFVEVMQHVPQVLPLNHPVSLAPVPELSGK